MANPASANPPPSARTPGTRSPFRPSRHRAPPALDAQFAIPAATADEMGRDDLPGHDRPDGGRASRSAGRRCRSRLGVPDSRHPRRDRRVRARPRADLPQEAVGPAAPWRTPRRRGCSWARSARGSREALRPRRSCRRPCSARSASWASPWRSSRAARSARPERATQIFLGRDARLPGRSRSSTSCWWWRA